MPRGNLYAEAGADAIFVEAPQSVEELREIAANVKAPLVVSLVEGGKTPLLTVDELAGMGYKIISFSTTLPRVAGKAMQDALKMIRETGTTQSMLDCMISVKERNQILGLDRVRELEKIYLPPS